MLKDFVPAKTSLQSGVVIKQHLLERNRIPEFQLSYERNDYSGSISVGSIEGGAGGSVNRLNPTSSLSSYFTQSYGETLNTIAGTFNVTHSSQDEFYNGELSGSTLLVSNGELNDENTFKYPSTLEISYDIIFYTSSVTPLNTFNNINTSPNSGEIYLWYDTGSILDTGEGQGGYQAGGPIR